MRSTFYFSPSISYILAIVACSTAIISSFLGTKLFDLKRIIAYSTCSQIGLMTLSVSLGNYLLSLFHLVVHAFFKCLLFLCAGSIIHSLNNEQDIRKMGGLFKYLPLTCITFLLASLSLMGFPYFSGFFSKDLLLEHEFFSGVFGQILYGLTSLAAIVTTYYSIRLVFVVFFDTIKINKNKLSHIHEPTALMLVPMLLLLFAAIFFGLFCISNFIAPFALYNIKNNLNYLFDRTFEMESITFPINNFPLDLVFLTFLVCLIFLVRELYLH